MRRISIVAVSTLLALAALGSTALAKEGAVTKFDSLPGSWHAGQTYNLGYTILMDGKEPYQADKTEIVVRNGTGKVLSYPGTPDGTPGHYVARVYFPAAGTYTWQVVQGTFFPPMDLGTVAVLPPVTASDAAPAAAPANEPIGLGISFLAVVIAIGASIRLMQLLRARRPAVA